MPKPVILYILHSYFNTAGTEEHVRLLCRELSDSFDCFIASPFRDKIVLIHEGNIIKEYPATQLPWPITSEHSPVHKAALESIHELVKPSLVHIHHLMNWHLGMLGDVLAWQVPVAMSFHDYFSITPHFTMQGIEDPRVTLGPNYSKLYFGSDISPSLKVRREILSPLIARLSKRIVPSRYCEKIHAAIFPGTYSVIEHGIEKFVPAPVSPRERCTFGYIGGLLPQKGYSMLLDAFERFHLDYPDSALVVHGDGDGAQKRPIPGVIYTGLYQAKDLPRLMSSFDVGIIPSVFAETFCLTLSELWMGKKPVLASRIGALSERVSDGMNGFFFSPGNVDELVAGMRRFYTSQEWRSWSLPEVRTADTMAMEYKAVYKELVNV